MHISRAFSRICIRSKDDDNDDDGDDDDYNDDDENGADINRM